MRKTQSISLQKYKTVKQVVLIIISDRNFTYLYTRTVSDILKLGRTLGICVCRNCRAHGEQQLIG